MANNAAFDLETAKQMLDSFYASTGVGCRLLGSSGDAIYENGIPIDECEFLRNLPGQPPHCTGLHASSMLQAERFGGRYIYTCASGMTYFTSPIVCGGATVGAFVAGPVLITDVDDNLDDLMHKRGVPNGGSRLVRLFLTSLPQMEPARVRHLSILLFSIAVYVSDSSRLMLQRQSENRQQSSISSYVHQVKHQRLPTPYPIEKEAELSAAISSGDKDTASALLNEILGYIFFFNADPSTTQTRITELLVLLSRAAIDGGADADLILSINHQYMQELRQLRSQEDVAGWLAAVLNRLTDLVFDLVGSKHKNIIRKAVAYMKLHCAEDLTLERIADHVGYSQSHFSKIFKEEMGIGFRAYLILLRVEKSKGLLLSGSSSIAEVCNACGFEDQSYFCKIFKKNTGISPDKFRKQSRRIDTAREHGV